MVNGNDGEVPPPTKTLRDRLNPSRVIREPGVVLPASTVKFDIKPGTFGMLRKFRGIENENPYTHVRDFEMICDTMSYPNVPKDVLRLRLFPFSLEERANEWYHLIPSKTITTWDGLIEAFVKNFNLHYKTAAVRQSIQTFKQKIGETLHDYVERFNELLYQCPHHGFDKAHISQILYEGLDSETRMQVETMSGGQFTHQDPDECFDEFIELAEKTRQWDSMREPEITSNPIHRVNRIDNGSDIIRRLEALEMNQGSNQTMSCNSEPRTYPCTICGDQSHIGPHCPLFYPSETTRDQVSVLHGGMNFNYENRPKFDPYSNTYNPGWRHNPNFSWSKGAHQGDPSSNPPPGFHRNQDQVQEPIQVEQKVSSLEETLIKFMETSTRNSNQSSQKLDDFVLASQCYQQNTSQAIINLETQISQLSNRLSDRENGTFPSQPTPNPKGVNQVNESGSSNHNEHVKAVITLRSGKKLENWVEPPKDSSPSEKETEVDQTSSKDRDPNGPESAKNPSEEDILERVYTPPAPFPQRLAKKKPSTYAEILDIFKQVKINLPLLDAIKHVPTMDKFLKDMCTVKRDANVHKKAFFDPTS
ncbi:uncharacterized protein LOC113295827 [Papaver somniferum]|uniref:uncharacterized protein LOC113295827 n=1 Tax=Papaver somniferum TaxID=3469 RepID=UPI000E6FCDA1|nr:uncharacterized protein LOC113295827 [Papaver somniferum]